MVSVARPRTPASDGPAVSSQEFKNFKAELLQSIFHLGAMQYAISKPTAVTPGAAEIALDTMRKAAEKAAAEAEQASVQLENDDEDKPESEDESQGVESGGDGETVVPTVEALQETKSESDEESGDSEESGSSDEEDSDDEEAEESDSEEDDEDVEMSAV